MRILYSLSANIIFIFHLFIGIFILLGWLWPEIQTVYLTILILWASYWIFFGYCPITKLEFLMRSKYQKDIDIHADFIQHYVKKFFKKDISTQTILRGGFIIFLILIALTSFAK